MTDEISRDRIVLVFRKWSKLRWHARRARYIWGFPMTRVKFCYISMTSSLLLFMWNETYHWLLICVPRLTPIYFHYAGLINSFIHHSFNWTCLNFPWMALRLWPMLCFEWSQHYDYHCSICGTVQVLNEVGCQHQILSEYVMYSGLNIYSPYCLMSDCSISEQWSNDYRTVQVDNQWYDLF